LKEGPLQELVRTVLVGIVPVGIVLECCLRFLLVRLLLRLRLRGDIECAPGTFSVGFSRIRDLSMVSAYRSLFSGLFLKEVKVFQMIRESH